MKRVRSIAVEPAAYGCRGSSYSIQPIGSKIRLCGQWLEAAGFAPGSRVSVTLDCGALVIRPLVAVAPFEPETLARLDACLARADALAAERSAA